jgi:hypothetical protein
LIPDGGTAETVHFTGILINVRLILAEVEITKVFERVAKAKHRAQPFKVCEAAAEKLPSKIRALDLTIIHP